MSNQKFFRRLVIFLVAWVGLWYGVSVLASINKEDTEASPMTLFELTRPPARDATTEGWDMPEFRQGVRVIILRDENIQKAWRAHRPDSKLKRVLGFWTGKQGPGCVIYVPPLYTIQSLEVWRHELRHCAEGRWHGP